MFFKNIVTLLDANIDARQKILAYTTGPLDMEIEAWNKAYYLSWVPYVIFVTMTVWQFMFFHLYNRKYHPLAQILDGKLVLRI